MGIEGEEGRGIKERAVGRERERGTYTPMGGQGKQQGLWGEAALERKNGGGG